MKRFFDNLSEWLFVVTFFACPISWSFIESSNPIVITMIVAINAVAILNFFGLYVEETTERRKHHH